MRRTIYWPALLLLLTACGATQAEAEIVVTSGPTPVVEVQMTPLEPTATLTQAPVVPSPSSTATSTPLPPTQTWAPTATPSPTPLPAVRQITRGDCCTDPFWNADSTEVRFIDRPTATDPVGVWGVDITQLDPEPKLVLERLAVYSPDDSLIAYPDREQGVVIIERMADGQQWEIDSQGSSVSFTPDSRQLLWTVYDSEVPWRARTGEIWLADTNGENAALVATLERGGPAAWLSETELLISSRVPPSQNTLLSTLSIEDGTLTELIQLPRARDGALSPDRRYLAYLVRHDTDPDQNGLWFLDLQSVKLKPEPLPFFGAYRWRDDRRLIYVPFDPEATEHVFYEYDIRTGRSRQLFPTEGSSTPALTIANNNWQVSPDGSKIALLAATGTALDGIWVIDIGQN